MSTTNHAKHVRPAPSLLSTEISDTETGAMLRAFFKLAEHWQLNESEARILLGKPSPRSYSRWKTEGTDTSRISHDMRQRLSMLMGIHKALRYIFKDAERGYAWIKKPNEAFNGQSALDRMLAGGIVDLEAVRFYLDAERGGW